MFEEKDREGEISLRFIMFPGNRLWDIHLGLRLTW